MGKTTIAWCDYTSSLWHGCVEMPFKNGEIHPGCLNCYARILDGNPRLGGKFSHWGNSVPRRAIKGVWDNLRKWNEKHTEEHPGIVFCDSMNDIFEKPMPYVDHTGKLVEGQDTGYLRDHLFYDVIPYLENLEFLLLTKRVMNIKKYIPSKWLDYPLTNVMYGYSVSNQETYDYGLKYLAEIPGVKFLSAEPLIGPIDLHINSSLFLKANIQWVIGGGESQVGCRPHDWDWERILQKDCHEARIPYFLKQGGGHPYKHDKLSDFPEDLREQQFPSWFGREGVKP